MVRKKRLTVRSVFHGPATMAHWQLMLDDLGRPSPARVASYLRCTEEEALSYERGGPVPWSAQLAMFWLTRWGMSLQNANAVNDANIACQYAQCLEARLVELGQSVPRFSTVFSLAERPEAEWLNYTLDDFLALEGGLEPTDLVEHQNLQVGN